MESNTFDFASLSLASSSTLSNNNNNNNRNSNNNDNNNDVNNNNNTNTNNNSTNLGLLGSNSFMNSFQPNQSNQSIYNNQDNFSPFAPLANNNNNNSNNNNNNNNNNSGQGREILLNQQGGNGLSQASRQAPPPPLGFAPFQLNPFGNDINGNGINGNGINGNGINGNGINGGGFAMGSSHRAPLKGHINGNSMTASPSLDLNAKYPFNTNSNVNTNTADNGMKQGGLDILGGYMNGNKSGNEKGDMYDNRYGNNNNNNINNNNSGFPFPPPSNSSSFPLDFPRAVAPGFNSNNNNNNNPFDPSKAFPNASSSSSIPLTSSNVYMNAGGIMLNSNYNNNNNNNNNKSLGNHSNYDSNNNNISYNNNNYAGRLDAGQVGTREIEAGYENQKNQKEKFKPKSFQFLNSKVTCSNAVIEWLTLCAKDNLSVYEIIQTLSKNNVLSIEGAMKPFYPSALLRYFDSPGIVIGIPISQFPFYRAFSLMDMEMLNQQEFRQYSHIDRNLLTHCLEAKRNNQLCQPFQLINTPEKISTSSTNYNNNNNNNQNSNNDYSNNNSGKYLNAVRSTLREQNISLDRLDSLLIINHAIDIAKTPPLYNLKLERVGKQRQNSRESFHLRKFTVEGITNFDFSLLAPHSQITVGLSNGDMDYLVSCFRWNPRMKLHLICFISRVDGNNVYIMFPNLETWHLYVQPTAEYIVENTGISNAAQIQQIYPFLKHRDDTGELRFNFMLHHKKIAHRRRALNLLRGDPERVENLFRILNPLSSDVAWKRRSHSQVLGNNNAEFNYNSNMNDNKNGKNGLHEKNENTSNTSTNSQGQFLSYLDENQCTVVHSILDCISDTNPAPPIYIHGPAGCGKTSVLIELLTQVKHRFPNKKVGVCSSSNQSLDVILKRLDETPWFNEQNVTRLASYKESTGQIREANLRLYFNFDEYEIPTVRKGGFYKDKMILFPADLAGEIQYFVKDNGTKEFTRQELLAGYFDILIVDEVNQACWGKMLPLLQLMGLRTKVILVGDAKQLPPVTNIKELADTVPNYLLRNPLYSSHSSSSNQISNNNSSNNSNISSTASSSLFLSPSVSQQPQVCFKLNKCYRSNVFLADFLSQAIYDALIQPGQQDLDCKFAESLFPYGSYRPAQFPFLFVGMVGRDAYDLSYQCFYNKQQIIACQKVLENLIHLGNIAKTEIAIICATTYQVLLMRQFLKKNDMFGIDCGDVSYFQGREYKVVLCCTVYASSKDTPDPFLAGEEFLTTFDNKESFLQSSNILNVAITRGTVLTIVVGDPFYLLSKKDSPWRKLLLYCGKYGSYIGHRCEPLAKAVLLESSTESGIYVNNASFANSGARLFNGNSSTSASSSHFDQNLIPALHILQQSEVKLKGEDFEERETEGENAGEGTEAKKNTTEYQVNLKRFEKLCQEVPPKFSVLDSTIVFNEANGGKAERVLPTL